MPKPDLIHVIFNGGQDDESQGIVSLHQRRWLFYTWGRFSGHHTNSEANVATVAIADSDFKLLLTDGDDPNAYHDLANWEHVVELLNCPALQLDQRLGEQESPGIELLVVVKGDASGRQIRKLEAIVGHSASDVTRIGGNTDVLFHEQAKREAQSLAAKLEKLKFVASVAINQSSQ